MIHPGNHVHFMDLQPNPQRNFPNKHVGLPAQVDNKWHEEMDRLSRTFADVYNLLYFLLACTCAPQSLYQLLSLGWCVSFQFPYRSGEAD